MARLGSRGSKEGNMNKIFWGLLFLLIDIKINSFSITPSFIGCILIGVGMKEVEDSAVFRKTQPLAVVLGIWSAVFWLIRVNHWAVSLIGNVLQLALTYQIMSGVKELETLRGKDLMAGTLRKAWYVEAVCTVLVYLLGMFTQLAVAALLIGFLAMVVYVVAFYQSKKALNNENAD